MVVGSNAGLGLEASVHIACMKPKLLLVTCRDSDKLKFAIDLGQLSWSGQYHDKGSQQVEACSLDLSKFDGVRAVADHMAVKEDRQLNIIIANAGVLLRDYSSTPDGWDSSLVGLFLQLNTPLVGTVLLSILLLPFLVRSSTVDLPSRIVFVSSDAGTWDRILETVNNDKFSNDANGHFRESRYYDFDLLSSIIFLCELEARLPKPSLVVVCSVGPGLSEQGSRTLLHGAIGGDARVTHGQYLSSCCTTRESEDVFTPEGQRLSKKLWDKTISLLFQIDEEAPQKVGQYLCDH
ncbi:hypothetical protein V8B97DRAFT_2104854 [Scleroderma yunnanense]